MHHAGNHMIDPSLLFEKAQLQPGMHIADFGCGRTGHIVFPAARVIGERGAIYAVDILKPVLEEINKRAASSAMHNIHTIWANLERPGATAISQKNLDIGFLVNVLVQSDHRHEILDEVYRLLKPKSRLVVVDWARRGLQFGPEDQRYVDFEDIKQWARGHHFAVQEEFECGPYHHGMVLYKHD